MWRGEDDPNQNPRDPKTRLSESSDPVGVGINGPSGDACIFSPRFKSAAAMAGWDAESILVASLVVDDTPEREFKNKRRSDSHFKTPPTNSSRRKRRAPRRSPISIPVTVLNLDDDEEPEKDEATKEKAEQPIVAVNKEKEKGDAKMAENSSSISCSSSNLPCLDKLRDELSCAICLEICFEPTTTPCGHSFCKKCLRSAADKCGKRCPKCRQLISNSRSCTINTVLWNTIQLLFPQEVEARKAAGASSSREAEREIPDKAFYNTRSIQSRRASSGVRVSSSSSREMIMMRRRIISSPEQEDDAALPVRRFVLAEPEPSDAEQGGYSHHRSVRSIRASSRDVSLRRSRRTPSQDEDAALALRLQREEFMEVFRGTHEQSSSSLALARANLRAMTSRATSRHATTRNL